METILGWIGGILSLLIIIAGIALYKITRLPTMEKYDGRKMESDRRTTGTR